MADYSKWDAMARAQEEDERREKEQKRAANRDKYFREQEEKKAKYLQEQEAKKKAGADTHAGHSHGGGDGHAHGHSHSHGSEGGVPPGMQPLLSTVPRPACGCGYADVEEMKRAAEAAALKPQLSEEEKTKRKVAAVHATREHGKQLYLEGKYAEAFAVYERGVLIASGIYNVDEALQAQLTAMEVLLDVNMAQCQLKLGQWKAATDQARMALQLDPQCAKAHFRMAQAYVGMGEYEQARGCLALCTAADTAGATRRDVAALQTDIRRREIDEREKLHKFTKQLEAKMAKEKAFGGADDQTDEGAAAASSDSATAAAVQPAVHSAVPSPAASSSPSTAAAAPAAAATTAAPSDPDSDISDLTQSLRTAQLQPADPDSWTVDGASHQKPTSAAPASASAAPASART